jgi:hypothetical protein
MGAILDAAVDRYGEELTISDPFSGGGTVTFESVRRGVRAYAQDLYPWPARGLAAALATCSAEDLQRATIDLLLHLEPLRGTYRNDAGAELSHVLRVRRSECRGCGVTHHEFQHPLVSVASRAQGEKHAWFGCFACGQVSKRQRDVGTFGCGHCGTRWTVEECKSCWTCGHADLQVQAWTPVLVQELVQDAYGRWRGTLRPPREGDPTDAQSGALGIPSLDAAIPAGRETNRLIESGLTRWSDLYTRRQAEVLVSALAYLSASDLSQALRDRLAFVVLGGAEMPGFACRWDRFHLKAFEGMANHRFSSPTLAVETNLLSPLGRGTLPNRLVSAKTTLQWLIESSDSCKVVSTLPGSRGRRRTDWDVLIATGSSARQALHDRSVSVVVTDPPYFEDVQYGELSRLFHAWLKVYDPAVDFDEQQEAVHNPARGLSAADYESTIAACLTESRRTLKKDGTLVLTFHNRRLAAWRALAGALVRAGFVVKALAIVHSDNHGDHCKRSVESMLHDLVLECVPRVQSKKIGPVRLHFRPRAAQEKTLAAMGVAVARCVRDKTVDSLAPIYLAQLTRLKVRRRLIK